MRSTLQPGLRHSRAVTFQVEGGQAAKAGHP
jgi:hypothetical protein